APADSKIVSRPIYQLSLPRELTIGGVIRDGEGMLVEGRTQIQPGDNVVVFFIPGALGKVERLFR
ncbi:MAG: Trk system potassium transporter TrkA, partial [Duncaniella sp.]|nr:Trk system potassium transporter TrkA [Duncaniella sp.]